MLQWLLTWAEALKPYEQVLKILESILLFFAAAAAFYATRKIKAGTKEVRKLHDANQRLKMQVDETATTLTEAVDRAVQNLQAAISEDLINASQTKDGSERVAGVQPPPAPAGRSGSTEIVRPSSSASITAQDAHRLWWQPVIETKLPSSDQPPPKLYWKNNVRLPLPWPGTWLTVWRNEDNDGVCGVAVSGKGNAVDDLWQHLKRSAHDLEPALPAGSTVKPGRFGIGVTKPNSEFRNDDERRAWMQRTMLAFLATLTPRLKA